MPLFAEQVFQQMRKLMARIEHAEMTTLAPSPDREKSSVKTRLKKALSIRQPHAEAIMRGVKPIEFRSRPTKIRGRIYILRRPGPVRRRH